MRNFPISCVLAVAVFVAVPRVATAQSCTPVDSTLAMPLMDLKDLVASTAAQDAYDRQQLGIPAVDSATVSVVSDTRICDKVLAAFKPTLDASIAAPTKLFVMKAGTVYVALYPLVGTGETDIYRVVSNKYAILSKFAK
jgi:hypothetical protein